ncbi:MAG: tetratricopeptide repeat protein [Candidatus Brocadiia bacterium]
MKTKNGRVQAAALSRRKLVASVVLQVAFVAAIAAGLVLVKTAKPQEKLPKEAKSEKILEEFKHIRGFAAAGQHGEAARALREFVAKYPDWERVSEATVLLGKELVLAGDVSSGKQSLQRFVQKNPSAPLVPTAHFYVGKAQEALGDFPGAVLSYDVVVSRFPDHKRAPEAALSEALIAGRVLGNNRRARRVYEDFTTKYPKHPRIAAVQNHLAVMAEKGKGRAGGPTSAFMQKWQIATPFPNAKGKGLLKTYPPEQGVDLDAAYVGAGNEKVRWHRLPEKAKKTNGYVDLQAGFKINENVCAYAYHTFQSPEQRDGTLYIGSDDGVAVWFNGKKILTRNVTRGAEPDQEQIPVHLEKGQNSILLKISQGKGGWGFYCRLDYEFGWGPTAAVALYRDYAEKHPDDVGDPVLNGDRAGAAAAMWRAAELTQNKLHDSEAAVNLYKKYEALPRSKSGEGYYRAARLLWQEKDDSAAEMFEAALKAQPNNLNWRYEYARWLKDKKKNNAAQKQLSYVVRKTENDKQLDQTIKMMGAENVRKYLDENPGDYVVFRRYLSWYRGGEKRDEGRKILDTWLKRSEIDWKTQIAREWFEWTKELKDCRRLIGAAEAEGHIQETARASLQATDKLIHARMFGEAAKELEKSLKKWGQYPDFPRQEFARRVLRIASSEPLMVPNPEKKKEKKTDGEKADTDGDENEAKKLPDKIVSEKGKAARKKAIKLLREHGLDRTAGGADALARLSRELNEDDAAEVTKQAAVALIEAGKFGQAVGHVEFLLKNAPHTDETVDVLYEAGRRGHKPWGKHWKSTVLPTAQKELKHFEKAKKQTEATRLARVKLLRLFDPKKSISAHDEFLKHHRGSQQSVWVARHRFWEINRSKKDVADAITASIQKVEKNPDIALHIPIQLVPAGRKGHGALADALAKVLKQVKGEKWAQLALQVARLDKQQNRMADCMRWVERIIARQPQSRESVEAKKLGISLFDRGFFAPQLTQKDAQNAYKWQMELFLDGEGVSHTIADVTGNVWKLACHPAYRKQRINRFGSLYMVSAHGKEGRPKNMRQFMTGLYARMPGDGIGPETKVENRASPFKGGDKFRIYRWGLLRAPRDGTYHFWGHADDWVGLSIDGRQYNFPARGGNFHAAVPLTRGLHMCQIAYIDFGGGYHMRLDWRPPTESDRVPRKRMRAGAQLFSPEYFPLILSESAAFNGAWGLKQWESYVKKFPDDRRGHMMLAELKTLADPKAGATEMLGMRKKYPSNPHFRERCADCLWRSGQKGRALEEYENLAAGNHRAVWKRSYNALYRSVFLGGKTPVGFDEQLADRVRAADSWGTWQKKVSSEGHWPATDGLRARNSAAGHLRTLERRATEMEESVSFVKTAISKEKAQLASAEKLANKKEAKKKVRAQARRAVGRSQDRLEMLNRELSVAQTTAKNARKRATAFRKELGIAEDAGPEEFYLDFAEKVVSEKSANPDAVYHIAQDLWDLKRKADARRFLKYVIHYSPHRHHIDWCADRLVELATDGENVAEAVEVLSNLGWRNPRDKHHANWLKRACEMAREAGEVYEYARNARVLARLHPKNNDLNEYVDRMGEVFEKAGNYVSAEHEYRRVIRHTRDRSRQRTARLSLAELYQKRNRPREALETLSKLVDITIPDDGKGRRRERRNVLPDGGGVKKNEQKEEDADALLLAARCYLDLEKKHLALEAYDRAAAQKTFGKKVKPERDLLIDLAKACLQTRRVMESEGKKGDMGEHEAVPPVILEQARKSLALIDTLFRFYADKMDPYQKTRATLVRADANIMMRNYPRAIEEIRKAKKEAGDSPARYLADLKMGEVHLATDNDREALRVFKKLAELNRKKVSPLALFWLGTTRLKMNEREKAIEAFRILWERYADNDLVREAVYAIAQTYAKQGAFLDAIRLYEAVGAINSAPRKKVVPGEVLTVKVWDADHYLGTGQYTIPVNVQAASGDVESMKLEMNKINHSLFLGTIRTELGEPNPNDRILQVYGTDVIYVTYQDKFKGFTEGDDLTAEDIKGERSTSLIQVVQDAELKVSPRAFVEREEEAEDEMYRQKTEDELREEKRLRQLSARLQRGKAVVRPGNAVYLRLRDGDLDSSGKKDRAKVRVFTYSPGQKRSEKRRQRELARAMKNPMDMPIRRDIPSNGSFSHHRTAAPPPNNRPRLDSVEVFVEEIGAHEGIFYGTVQTAVNGPTAVASDHSGERVAAYAIDGEGGADDAWMGFIDGKPDKWIEIDLKELHYVSKITWDRGEGADDRYMIDYTVSMRGEGPPKKIEKEGNKSAHDNEIALEKPVRCRWIRFTAHKYEGDAPAISHIEIVGSREKDAETRKVVPPEVSPLERARNDVLEFNVGDCMAAEVVDDENLDPGHSVTRQSNPLGVAYVDGHIDAVHLSYDENRVRGSVLTYLDREKRRKPVYSRRTKRVKPDEVLQIAIMDPDLDVDDRKNKATCEVYSTSGDKATLEAKEIAPTAAVFVTRIQLSTDQSAQESDMRLWVRSGDYIMLRYRDEQNRHPGHAIYRESFVFAADDEVARFPDDQLEIRAPKAGGESIEPPNWTFALVDPDRALPGIDRVEMEALSFATRDHARFNLLLRDLDGLFTSKVPVQIADKPHVQLPEDADPTKPRRIYALDEAWGYRNQRRRSENEQNVFRIPFSVLGDDIVYLRYTDPEAKEAAGRQFVSLVQPRVLDRLHKLGVNVRELPEAAAQEGITVTLRDPDAALKKARQERLQKIKREIAAKKIQYRTMLQDYESTLERIGKRIDDLTEQKSGKEEDTEETTETPKEVMPEDAPLTATESGGEDLAAGGLSATENLILAAALRRDRDGLTEGMRALKRRLDALGKYETAEIEAQIKEEREAVRQKAKEEGKTEEKEKSGEKPAPWYTLSDWWKNCGGLVPGTTLNIRVEDPHLQGESAKVLVSVLGGQLPRYRTYTAEQVDGKVGVFEVSVPTTEGGGGEKALNLKGAENILLTYKDDMQTEFTKQRVSYLSLASDATLQITGADFLDQKEKYHLGEDVFILIRDADMDKTSSRDYVWVEVESGKGDRELLAVRESQPHSGVFRGDIGTRFGKPVENDGTLCAAFGGSFSVRYEDQLWRGEGPVPPELKATGHFVKGSKGTVEIFARQLKRGKLQRDVLFNTALAEYELGKSSTEMGAVQRGEMHLTESRDQFNLLIEQYPDDPVCAHATYYLGNIYFLLGDYPAAVQSLQRVIDRWPDSKFKAKSLYKLGTCHLKAGKRDKAIEAFVNLAYHHSESPLVAEAMLTLAQHFSKEKLYHQAIGIGQAFIRKFPAHEKTGSIYLRLAGWLIMKERLQHAAAVLEDAEKELPESKYMPAYLYWHADCLFKIHGSRSTEYKKGIILLKRITYDYPDSKWAKYAKARLAEVDVD